ncbi:MAG: mobile mystery protein A [uncultured bacterium (gcode 4)]|uniref:Mobile mystery protein A n=1 Tax=uncultured bacterium (gcode 4) TaxID=1234023 RepID=K1Z3S1_9BACT|nr:MAG: mobile mystery protein A [uncultured bacterium (gcode 4)]
MNIQSVRLLQVSDSLESVGNLPPIQKYWWLSTIRESLWMTVTTASKRAWVSVSAWITAEKREVEWTISLETLRKFLSALNCDLVYMPVPRIRPLSKMVEKQAFEFTRKEVMAIDSTMTLENQAPKEEFTQKMIKNQAEDIIRSGNWKKIWQ